MRGKWVVPILIIAGLLLPVTPAASQGGNGVIVEGGVVNPQSLNPLRCADTACFRVTGFLFPALFGMNLDQGAFSTGGGLTQSWTVSPDGTVYTFHLRDDQTWTDGTPVTAYDVFYSYRAIASGEINSPYTGYVTAAIRGAVPLDAYTIALVYHEPACNALDAASFPVIPAHVFEPDFAATAAAAFNSENDLIPQIEAWETARSEHSFAFMSGHPFDRNPTVTAGMFRLDDVQPFEHIRLATADGELAYELVHVPDQWDRTSQFLSGELNVLRNPPFIRLDDVRQADGVQVFEYPGLTWDTISFNLADPRQPQDALDENGSRLDQGHHPIFGDVRVRRAIQMALDVDALIEASVWDGGTVMAANQIPLSWAFDADLTPVPYDPVGAARLLLEAGWPDSRPGGFRECLGCLYAEEGTLLAFELVYDESASARHAPLAAVIQEQLGKIGIAVNVNSLYEATSTVNRQRYDAYLTSIIENYPVDPDQTGRFTSAGDVIGEGSNTGSYYNPQVDELMAQARSLPGCDLTARADLYRQIQTIVQADQPYIWLFAVNDMLAARDSVIGFDPYPFAPFWNISEWRIRP
ncbi:MAG: hypothetical protein JXQ72_02580 [Anaerolineae bacterium]|nr:hypothetical protein [Anaerolineae bacterium]